MPRPRVQLQSCFLAVAALVFVAVRFWRLTSYGLFGDEVFTLWTSAQDWHSLFQSVVEDVVHPPLFYALLKVWIDVGGQSLLWIKLLPALLSILSIAPFLLLCRELNLSGWAAGLALWLMAVNGFLIGHAQEPRMYGLLLLFVLCSLWLFLKLRQGESKSKGILIALSVVNLLMVFTHYFGWVVVAFELVFLIFSRREIVPQFVMSVALVAICFSPWAYFVAGAATANPSRATFFWNRPPPWSELIGYYANLNGPLSYRWKIFGTAIVMILYLAPIITKGARIARARVSNADSSRFLFLSLFAFGPVALAFAASHILPQPIWAFRYLIIAAPCYLILVAVSAQQLRHPRNAVAFTVLIAGWAALSGFTDMMDRDLVAWEPLVNRMIQSERDRSGAKFPVAVFVTDPNVGNTIQFYLDKAGEEGFRVRTVNDFKSPPEERSWIALIRYNHESQPPVQALLVESGYRVGDLIEAKAAGHRALLFPVWKP